MSAMAFKLNFDLKMFWATFRQKAFLGPLELKVKNLDCKKRLRGLMCHFLLATYHSIVNKNKIIGQFIFWVFIAIFNKTQP